jgi:hypothetical protein
MSNLVRMPTEDELAELSVSELNVCIKAAFYQWQESVRTGEDSAANKQIFHAYDNEQIKRLARLKKYLVP